MSGLVALVQLFFREIHVLRRKVGNLIRLLLFDLRLGENPCYFAWKFPFTKKQKHRRDTWLILPVVICLSQRLSHACLSTSLIKVKPRMAH